MPIRTPGRGAGSLTSPDLETQRRAVVSTPGSVSHIDAETYGKMRFFLGDVRDRDRLTLALRGVDISTTMRQLGPCRPSPVEGQSVAETPCTGISRRENAGRRSR